MLPCRLREVPVFLLAVRFVTLAVLVAPPLACAGEKAKFQWVDVADAGTADLKFGEQPVLRYMYAYDTSSAERTHETYKPYHHVFGPGTERLITKGPGGLYTHHRGMFVGWNRTTVAAKTLDFWHCKAGVHLRHRKFLRMDGDADSGAMTSEIHWNDAGGQAAIVETRTVAAKKEPETGGWQVDWKSELTSQRGEITLDGDRQHAGFQFRADQPVAEANGARYIRPEGFPQQAEAVQVGDKGDPPPHINLGWLAMTYQLDGTRYTVEYFEDPSLPKPSLYSERPYGRFGAFFKTTLTPDKPLTLRYRLVVSTGEVPSRAAIQKRYDAFVAELQREG